MADSPERRGNPISCQMDYTEEEVAFQKAIDRFKRERNKPFPTWSEVLSVLKSLGYRKVEAAGPLPGKSRDFGASGERSADDENDSPSVEPT